VTASTWSSSLLARGRLEVPIPRSYSPNLDGTDGIGFSNASGRITYGAIQLVSARDLRCPDCQAGPQEDCTTGRMSAGKKPVTLLCPGRVELARHLRDQGKLAVTEVTPPARCARCTWYAGQVRACPQHRCGEGSCANVALPGSRSCDIHGNSRLKMTPEKQAEMHRLHAEGLNGSEIARRLSVSAMTISKYLRGAGQE
jgi:hypothetical protein